MNKKKAFLLCILAGVVVMLASVVFYKSIICFPMQSDSIKISDVEMKGNNISFSVIRLDTLGYLKHFNYKKDENGTLQIKFYGTLIKGMAYSDSNRITLNDVYEIKNIIVVDKFSVSNNLSNDGY